MGQCVRVAFGDDKGPWHEMGRGGRLFHTPFSPPIPLNAVVVQLFGTTLTAVIADNTLDNQNNINPDGTAMDGE